ncbi:ATP-grasp domain-containing protein [Streptomyces sp. NPDC059009]|uniref:ATP-grasp domain-containing protein n=1 Tax=Streptomyces sp. NPDC059009 TaxID=3346694 RepID=UPI003684DC4C
MPAIQRVLVTGVGGAPGFDLTRRLLSLNCDVIAADANPLACGLLLDGVTPRLLPKAAEPDFRTRLLEVCRDLRPHALMCAVEHELPTLVSLAPDLEALGVRTWLPGPDAVTACLDKAAFHTALAAHGIPTPATFLPAELDNAQLPLALVVKPRRGHGSQGVSFCESRDQAHVLCELTCDPIVQELVEGSEFTADCLVDHTGRASVILRHRLLVKAGLAVVARTFHDDEAAEQIRRTLNAVGASGLCCVQGFLREGDADHVTVTEVNLRVAGGFPLAEAAGAQLVQQALNGLFDRPVDHTRLAYKDDVYLTKYFETLASGPHPIARRLTARTHTPTSTSTQEGSR